MTRNPPALRPFNNLLFRDFSRFFPSRLANLFDEEDFAGMAGWEPAIDVKEDEKEYVITADIPGVKPDDIDIRLENNVLTISGERKSETRDEKNGYRRVERFEGSFYRAMALPHGGDPEKVLATAKEGVISIRVPKAVESQSKRIKVST